MHEEEILGGEQIVDTSIKSSNFHMEQIVQEVPTQVVLVKDSKLPAHFKYSFLAEDSKLHAIISTDLVKTKRRG